jgi:hypothetical protein
MPNRRRGEVEAILDGKPHTLVLTLGALAELEAAFGASDLIALAERFESGRLSAHDLVTVLAAGLKGGGHAYMREEVAALAIDGGAAGYVRLAADLLAAAFANDVDTPEAASPARPRPARETSSPSPAPPFPGTR